MTKLFFFDFLKIQLHFFDKSTVLQNFVPQSLCCLQYIHMYLHIYN